VHGAAGRHLVAQAVCALAGLVGAVRFLGRASLGELHRRVLDPQQRKGVVLGEGVDLDGDIDRELQAQQVVQHRGRDPTPLLHP